MPLFTGKVVALRTRKERQQAATWRGNYNEQRYKRLKRVTSSSPKYCQCSRLLSKTNSEIAMKTGVVETKWCFENTQKLYPSGYFPPLDLLGKKVQKGKRPRLGQPWVTTLSQFCNTLCKVFLSRHRNCESVLSSMCMLSLKVLCTCLFVYFQERLIQIGKVQKKN